MLRQASMLLLCVLAVLSAGCSNDREDPASLRTNTVIVGVGGMEVLLPDQGADVLIYSLVLLNSVVARRTDRLSGSGTGGRAGGGVGTQARPAGVEGGFLETAPAAHRKQRGLRAFVFRFNHPQDAQRRRICVPTAGRWRGVKVIV